MTVSRSSVEDMDRDELVDTVLALAERVDDLETRFAAASTNRETLQDEIWTLEDRLEEQQDTIARLQGQVEPDPASKPYDEKTRDEKVFEVRVAVARRAASNGGRASMDYNNVLSLFGERPSPGHAYQLMRVAAGWEADEKRSTVAGYEYEPRVEANDRLRVDLEAVKDDAVIHAVNNPNEGEGGRE